MIDSIKQTLFRSKPFRVLENQLGDIKPGKPLAITGVHGSLAAFVIAALENGLNGQTLVIVPDRDRAEKLRDDCATVLNGKNVHLCVYAQHHAGTQLDMSGPVSQVEALRSLTNNESSVIIASAEATVGRLPSPHVVRNRSLTISASQHQGFEEFVRILEGMGFERKDFVEGYGDLAVRGGIVDVFPFVGDHPIRVEFFGDTVESIREFNVLSQRSIRDLRSSSLVGSIFSESSAGPANADATLFDYMHKTALIVFEDSLLIEKEIEELQREGVEDILSFAEVRQKASAFTEITHSLFSTSGEIDFGSVPQPPVNGSMKILLQELQARALQGYSLVIACDTPEEELRMKELLESEADRSGSAVPAGLAFTTEALHSGFMISEARVALLTEHEIFGRLKRRGGRKRPRFKGFSQRDVLRLKRGDYVVHSDYGIGMFAGLQTIKLRGVDHEVMRVLYDESDVVYVNLNFVNRVQKYASQEGHVPRLTKLGTPLWERLKARARKRIKDIARDLIALYARRKHETGFAFSPDAHWQKEMEASFMFEDTPDQEKATADVKKDMESSSPMDRLICGDVGFGKTEVAVRAAFKAVLDGKQAAILVPTTILAQQHANTFHDRLSRYAVRIEVLSRFKSKKDQQTVLQQLQEGSVDIVIGTHRLLSKDVFFKNLGLLVIDEEHRFGVAAKERLRRIRASVDTLTLTATPIPRTLQFSLMGARDLSLINTPPRNRLPIITEISEFDIKLIREAILKEIHRRGQVYVIHDRIQTMDEIVSLLQRHIPEARIHTAHGQMRGHELEKTMIAFLQGKYDVLVCTKIIESGIDIPTVNTIIINRAERFGLAELYQLRGRVGRSNVQAFAYLLTPPLSSLPRQSLQRLQAIQEFTELGSGFNLAMRDMEIRGAGNLLGAEQSGFILEMGIEMYQRIVEEAVRELKEQEFQMTTEPVSRKQSADVHIETDIEALIPDIYVESDSERLDIYRRMYEAQSASDVKAIQGELVDRFGEYPVEVDHLLRTIEVKISASEIGIQKVEILGNRLIVVLPSAEARDFFEATRGRGAPFQRIMEGVSVWRESPAVLQQEGDQLRLVIQLGSSNEPLQRFERAQEILKQIQTLAKRSLTEDISLQEGKAKT